MSRIWDGVTQEYREVTELFTPEGRRRKWYDGPIMLFLFLLSCAAVTAAIWALVLMVAWIVGVR